MTLNLKQQICAPFQQSSFNWNSWIRTMQNVKVSNPKLISELGIKIIVQIIAEFNLRLFHESLNREQYYTSINIIKECWMDLTDDNILKYIFVFLLKKLSDPDPNTSYSRRYSNYLELAKYIIKNNEYSLKFLPTAHRLRKNILDYREYFNYVKIEDVNYVIKLLEILIKAKESWINFYFMIGLQCPWNVNQALVTSIQKESTLEIII